MFFLEVDPSTVKPGWTPLIITILLAAAIALLMISMRRQMRKISVPHREEIEDSGEDSHGGAESDRTGNGRSAGHSESGAGSEDDQTTLGGTSGERHPIGHG